MVEILRTFETPESRLEALKQLIGVDDRAARRVYAKIEGSVNLGELTDQNPKKRARTSLLLGLFLLLIALIGLAYSAITSKRSPQTPSPSPFPTTSRSTPEIQPSSPAPTYVPGVSTPNPLLNTPEQIPNVPIRPSPKTILIAGLSEDTESGRWMKARADDWAQKTGNKLEYIGEPYSASETLQKYEVYWAARSPEIDVFLIDATWVGTSAPHSVDLKRYFKEDEIKQHFPAIIENNTLADKIVAMPFDIDAGLLYYRLDLWRSMGITSHRGRGKS